MSNELTVIQQSNISAFSNEHSFDVAQKMVRPLVSSGLVPAIYKDNVGNALIALDMANRMGLSPIVVMQNLHVIEGRPSWSSSFIISALASCGLFSPIRWRVTDLGETEVTYETWEGPKGNRTRRQAKAKLRDKEFVAYAVEKATGEVLEGPPVTLSMAVAEGWYYKTGSKWQTMPDLMGRYRSAAFFGRLYAPHITNGMPTADETEDTAYSDYEPVEDAPKPKSKKSVAEIVKEATKEDIVVVDAVVVEPEPVKVEPVKAEPVKQETKPAATENAKPPKPPINDPSYDERDIPPPTSEDIF